MSDKSKPDLYIDHINSHILPFIDYGVLDKSYSTDMIYAKGILNRLHEAMITIYGSERIGEHSSDDGFVVIPGIVRGRESGTLGLALLDLDLSSSGEHWGTSFLCKYGVISQGGNGSASNDDAVLKSEIKEIVEAYVPYDYCYTAVIPSDIHVSNSQLPAELKNVLNDFHNHHAELLFEEDNAPSQDSSSESVSVCVNGEIKPGDLVLSSPDNDYAGLVGTVIYIEKAGTPEHGTENPGDDIHVNFTEAEYSQSRFIEIDRMLGDLYGRPTRPGIWPPIDVDDAIMAPDMLIRITGIEQDKLTEILDSGAAASTFFNSVAESQASARTALSEPDALKNIENTAEKPSVLAQLRDAAKEPKQPTAKDKPNKSGPEL